MNLIGKIFTLLIFLMSLCFLVIAVMVGASDREWKKIAQVMKDRAVQAERILEDAKANTTQMVKLLETEKASRASQLAQLESQLKMARDDYEQKEEQLRAQFTIASAQLAELEEAQSRLALQDSELVDLRSTNNRLVEDIKNQFSQVRNLTNEQFNLKNKIQLQSEQEADLVNKLAKTQKVMIKNGLNENSNTDSIVPKRETVVTGVGNDGLFSIRLGLDDGIRIGHEMDIYRRGVGTGNARYVGKGKVIRVNDNMAVVLEIKDLMTGTVREGDYVTSKL